MLREEAVDAGTESTETAERAAELEEVDRARARWYAETAVTRDKAHRSGAELRARGIDLDASDDRVTADGWIEAHRAEQAEHERNQEHRRLRGGRPRRSRDCRAERRDRRAPRD